MVICTERACSVLILDGRVHLYHDCISYIPHPLVPKDRHIMAEAWKNSGFFRGVGIPAPSGKFTVGCVDLMQQVKEGEEDVFVRLFYPTATPAGEVSTEKYATWYPHKNYIRGFLYFSKSRAIGLGTFLTSTLISKCC